MDVATVRSCKVNEHIDGMAKIATNISYSISGGLTFFGVMKFLNEYAAACGVLLGIATFITNFCFQVANHKAIKSHIKSQDIEQ